MKYNNTQFFFRWWRANQNGTHTGQICITFFVCCLLEWFGSAWKTKTCLYFVYIYNIIKVVNYLQWLTLLQELWNMYESIGFFFLYKCNKFALALKLLEIPIIDVWMDTVIDKCNKCFLFTWYTGAITWYLCHEDFKYTIYCKLLEWLLFSWYTFGNKIR